MSEINSKKMKMVFIILQNEDVKDLMYELSQHNISCTRLASTGGFLLKGNTTLMVGIENERLDEVLKLVKENCQKRMTKTPVGGYSANDYMPLQFPTQMIDIEIGGATVFVVDIEKTIKY